MHEGKTVRRQEAVTPKAEAIDFISESFKTQVPATELTLLVIQSRFYGDPQTLRGVLLQEYRRRTNKFITFRGKNYLMTRDSTSTSVRVPDGALRYMLPFVCTCLDLPEHGGPEGSSSPNHRASTNRAIDRLGGGGRSGDHDNSMYPDSFDSESDLEEQIVRARDRLQCHFQAQSDDAQEFGHTLVNRFETEGEAGIQHELARRSINSAQSSASAWTQPADMCTAQQHFCCSPRLPFLGRGLAEPLPTEHPLKSGAFASLDGNGPMVTVGSSESGVVMSITAYLHYVESSMPSREPRC